MSVTVASKIRRAPGQGSTLVAALIPLLEQAPASARGRRVARLLQSADDRIISALPRGLRDNREGYLAHAEAVRTPPHETLPRRGAHPLLL